MLPTATIIYDIDERVGTKSGASAAGAKGGAGDEAGGDARK